MNFVWPYGVLRFKQVSHLIDFDWILSEFLINQSSLVNLNVAKTFQRSSEREKRFVFLKYIITNRNLQLVKISKFLNVEIKVTRIFRFLKFYYLQSLSSEFLDISFYLRTNLDVKSSGIDPNLHYWTYGYFEGRQPSSKLNVRDFPNEINALDREHKLDFLSRRYEQTNLFSGLDIAIKDYVTHVERSEIKIPANLSLKYRCAFIIPCYNQARFITDCLSSIASSTNRLHICIIINDGTDDRSEKILIDSIKPAESHQEIYLINQANLGLSSARNTGIQVANELEVEYIKFIDADDLLCPSSTDRQLSDLDFSNKDASIGGYVVYGEGQNLHYINEYPLSEIRDFENVDNNFLKEYFFEKWEEGLSIPIHSLMIKKSKIVKFNPNLRSKEDFTFWIEILDNLSIVNSIYPTAIYRHHSKQMTQNKSKDLASFIEAIKYLANLPRNKHLSKLISRKLFELNNRYLHKYSGNQLLIDYVNSSSERE